VAWQIWKKTKIVKKAAKTELATQGRNSQPTRARGEAQTSLEYCSFAVDVRLTHHVPANVGNTGFCRRIDHQLLMNSSRKPLSLLIALLLPLWSLSAGAVGLGDLTAKSHLGEPLRAEIRLLSLNGVELDRIACVASAPQTLTTCPGSARPAFGLPATG
jgi:hypothetical protein